MVPKLEVFRGLLVARPIQIDDVPLPPGHRAGEKPTGRTGLTVDARLNPASWPVLECPQLRFLNNPNA